MNRLVPLGLASLASLALMAPGAATVADVALVIGNHDCRQAPDAVSARADARAVAEACAAVASSEAARAPAFRRPASPPGGIARRVDQGLATQA